MKEQPNISTVPELADILRVSVRKAWEIVGDRQITVFRSGRRVLITAEAIAEYIAKNTTPAFDPKHATKGLFDDVGRKSK